MIKQKAVQYDLLVKSMKEKEEQEKNKKKWTRLKKWSINQINMINW